jgi:hypothetical protein
MQSAGNAGDEAFPGMPFSLPLLPSPDLGRPLGPPNLKPLRLRRHDRRRTTALAACVVLVASFVWGTAPQASPAAATASSGPPRAVAIAATPDGAGYWIASSSGGAYPFADAHSYGSMSGTALNALVVGMTATPSGQG